MGVCMRTWMKLRQCKESLLPGALCIFNVWPLWLFEVYQSKLCSMSTAFSRFGKRPRIPEWRWPNLQLCHNPVTPRGISSCKCFGMGGGSVCGRWCLWKGEDGVWEREKSKEGTTTMFGTYSLCFFFVKACSGSSDFSKPVLQYTSLKNAQQVPKC